MTPTSTLPGRQKIIEVQPDTAPGRERERIITVEPTPDPTRVPERTPERAPEEVPA